jgi:hypothetical protein
MPAFSFARVILIDVASTGRGLTRVEALAFFDAGVSVEGDVFLLLLSSSLLRVLLLVSSCAMRALAVSRSLRRLYVRYQRLCAIRECRDCRALLCFNVGSRYSKMHIAFM